MTQPYRRKLICFTGYHGFKEMLKPGEVLVIEFEDEDAECAVFEKIENARQFKKINRIDGGDIFGIWAWKESHWKTFRPKEDIVYEEILDRKESHSRVMEDIVLMSIHEGRSAWDVYRTVEDMVMEQNTLVDVKIASNNTLDTAI